MLKNIFSVSLIILLVVAGCGNDSNNKIYTGVLEGKSIQVPALTPGKILSFYVNTGEEVQYGDTLAIVDQSELELQLKQLNGSMKELKIRMEIANTSFQKANSDFDYIREKYQRMEKLVLANSMPQQTLDDLKIQMDHAEISQKATKQTMQSVSAKEDQLLAQIQLINKKIHDCFVTSPETGIIANKYFEKGEVVPPMSPLAELIHIHSVDVKIYIAEQTLPEVSYNQEVEIHVDGISNRIKGNVSWISPKAEFTPKTILTPETRSSLVFAVKITIPNPERILKHGMPVEVILARE
jgi:HlyD family secretion protein